MLCDVVARDALNAARVYFTIDVMDRIVCDAVFRIHNARLQRLSSAAQVVRRLDSDIRATGQRRTTKH